MMALLNACKKQSDESSTMNFFANTKIEEEYKKVIKTVNELKNEVLKADNLIEISNANVNKMNKKLNVIKNEYEKVFTRAKTDDAQKKCTAEYIKKRNEIIVTALNNSEFTVSALKKVIETMNKIWGDIDTIKEEMGRAEQFDKLIIQVASTCEDDESLIGTMYESINEQINLIKNNTELYIDYLDGIIKQFNTIITALKTAHKINDCSILLNEISSFNNDKLELDKLVERIKVLPPLPPGVSKKDSK